MSLEPVSRFSPMLHFRKSDKIQIAGDAAHATMAIEITWFSTAKYRHRLTHYASGIIGDFPEPRALAAFGPIADVIASELVMLDQVICRRYRCRRYAAAPDAIFARGSRDVYLPAPMPCDARAERPRHVEVMILAGRGH